MLIPFGYIVKKYRIRGGNILHLGAHKCEERFEYRKHGWGDSNVIWVEGNPEVCEEVKQANPSLNIHHGLISDINGDIAELIVTNNIQSSSILPLGECKSLQPWIFETRRMSIPTITGTSLLNSLHIPSDHIMFCRINIQGAELLALKGMKEYASCIKYIYIRVYSKHLYEGCPLIHEIDSYINTLGFVRKDTIMTDTGYGDALYVNENPKVTAVLRGGLGNRLFILGAMMGYAHKNPTYEPVILNSKFEPFYQPQQQVNISRFIRDIPRIDQMQITRMFVEPCGYDATFKDINQGINASGNLLLDGYFQHEKYFEGVEHWVENQFGCPLDAQLFIEATYPDLSRGAFIHVRRTDTLHLPYPDLTDYYNKCINEFGPDTVFFICSDDLDWCKENVKIYNNNVVFVEEDAIATLWIMSLCRRGGIVGISTYSWWAGWLCKRKFNTSVIFCPETRYNPSSSLFNMIHV